ncbi:ARMT1-like domain-containing protein [Vulcanisaeta souniana]|uniref:ARMT1-like domain-containing protein n=1 Tax=Vulcanisaeta souniana TaxID=164452 RepID=UPI0006D2511B|nr:ARMT1-like domain-containing protein [Vulcanisaeta souniana]
MRDPWYISISDCLLCVLESRFGELRRLGINDARSFTDLGRVVMNLAPLGRATVFIESFNHMTRSLNIVEPHGYEKLMLEKTARELINRLSLSDDIIDYVRLATSANSVDIPMRGGYDFNIDDFMRSILEEPTWLGTDPTDLRNRLTHARNIAYLVDNAGEFQFDLLLTKKLTSMGIKVIVYVKSKPYEVDVTHDYVANKAGSTNAETRALPSNYSAFWYDEVVRELMGYDLVISKGLDNLETFMERRPRLSNVLFLFRAKCPLIARVFNVERNRPVVMMNLRDN